MIRPEEFLRANDVRTPTEVMQYASQQIGCPKPIGNKARGIMLGRIKEELREQQWTIRHLVAAIDFMKSRGIRARGFGFVFYHVEPSIQAGFMPRPATSSLESLHEAVSTAIYLETDEEWKRRLLSARGSSLLKVYQTWEQERQPLLGGNS